MDGQVFLADRTRPSERARFLLFESAAIHQALSRFGEPEHSPVRPPDAEPFRAAVYKRGSPGHTMLHFCDGSFPAVLARMGVAARGSLFCFHRRSVAGAERHG